MGTGKKAFTLVEIMVAASVMGIIVIGIYSFFSSSRLTQEELFSKTAVVQEAQKFFKQFHKDVFSAREILFPSHEQAEIRTESYLVIRNVNDEIILFFLDTTDHKIYRKNLTKNTTEKVIAVNCNNLVFKKNINLEKYGDLNYVSVIVSFYQESKNKMLTKHNKFFITSILLNKQTTDFYTEKGPLARDRILQEFY